jgi:transglutaminase-like putative cysteine protease
MGDDDAPRVVVSPMVNIQARLVEQSDQELFTVRSPVESYWRLTSLDEFDGQIWKSSYGTSDAEGELPHAVDPELQVDEVTQAVQISALAEVWLPAAFEPLAIDAGDGAVDWDERSSTLIVDRDVPTSDGLEYQVVSTVPNWTEEELRSATDEVPDEIRDRYTALPDSLAPEVRQLAAELTANAQTPYDRALALQTHLRTFQYDLTAPRGHSADALSAFLFETRRGYCEQFAGSFAALAREVGLPTRVAVGFTSGVRDESDPELYRVSGEHAHAWVEVYLDPYGWVPFDPTPGRAPPRSEPPQSSGNMPATRPQQDDNGIATGGIDPDDGGGGGVGGAVRVVSRGLGAIGLAYLLLVPVALLLATALRRRRATTPGGRVRLAWQDALAAAERARVRIPPSDTVSEAAAELSDAFPPVAPAVHHLAGLLERATYAEVEPSPEEADVAARAGHEVVAAARRSMPWHWRLLRWVDVRELWRRRAAHHRRSAAAGVQAPRPLVGAR